MRTEEQMKELILSVAESDCRVRAVVLQGSRANPEAPRDEMMDYDVVYVVDSLESLKAMTSDLSWLDVFGEPVIRQTADDQLDWDDPNGYICMTQYADGVRIDLSFCLVESMQKDFACGDHDPSVVWLDKDGVLEVSPDAGHRWHVERPDERLYNICCNEFWWVAPYVAKGIWRRELSFAQQMATVNRYEIIHMAAWHIGINHGWNVSIGKCGKYLEKYLPPEMWQKYTRTYSAGDYDAMWAALETACELFRDLALEVAEHFGFTYPQGDDDRVTAFLQRVRKSASDRRRSVTCAFTGRRPQSLPWRYDDGHPDARAFARELRAEIKKAYNDGYRVFICGMAQGVDLLACEQTMILQENDCPDIKIVAAIPGKDQTRGWPTDQIERYNACLAHCSSRRVLAQFCSVESYHTRNRWMVDNAARLIAVWEGDISGGTGRTVDYARRQGVEVIKLWPGNDGKLI